MKHGYRSPDGIDCMMDGFDYMYVFKPAFPPGYARWCLILVASERGLA